MKKNKIIVGIVATMCNIPISLVLASIIHIQLSKIDVPKTLYDLSKIVVNEKFLPLFFLMFSLFEVLIFAMLVMNKNSFYSELDSITDKIQTPKSIGQGQHGTARWQTQKEFEKQDAKTVYYMSMEFLMGRALGNSMINLTCYNEIKEALEELGFDINAIEDEAVTR